MVRYGLIAVWVFALLSIPAAAQVDKQQFIAKYEKAVRPMRLFYFRNLTARESVVSKNDEQYALTTTAKDRCLRRDVGQEVLIANPNSSSLIANQGESVEVNQVISYERAAAKIYHGSILAVPFNFYGDSIVNYLRAPSVTIDRITSDGDENTIHFTDVIDMEGASPRKGEFTFLGKNFALTKLKFNDRFELQPGQTPGGVTGDTTLEANVKYDGEINGFPKVASYTMRLDGEDGKIWWKMSRNASKVAISNPSPNFFELSSIGIPNAGETGQALGRYVMVIAAVLGGILLAFRLRNRQT